MNLNQLAQSSSSTVAQFRLFQLISPSLPIGGFTYSQGLEWAVEAGWITDRSSMEQWLANVLFSSVATLELPIIERMYSALLNADNRELHKLSQLLYSCRETKELRAEEKQRGLALNTLLQRLDVTLENIQLQDFVPNQLVGLCLAAVYWQIELDDLKKGYLWSWAENLVMAGVKLIPLGQTDGQLALINLSNHFAKALDAALHIEDWMIGSFTPSVALASSFHETQYTRLFRS